MDLRVLSVSIFSLALLLTAFPAADASHFNVSRKEVALPCQTLDAATAPLGFQATEDIWTFTLDGVAQKSGRHTLTLKSDHGFILPKDTLFFGDMFSHFRGSLITSTGTGTVDLVWVKQPASVYEWGTQTVLLMPLVGNVTFGTMVQPMSLMVALAAPPAPCSAAASAFNWRDACPIFSDLCVPLSWEVQSATQVYYNGPAVYEGTLGGQPTAGAGFAHGTVLVETWRGVPF